MYCLMSLEGSVGKQDSVQLAQINLAPPLDWRDVEQMAAAIAAKGSWSNGVSTNDIKLIRVFIEANPETLADTNQFPCLRDLPVKKFVPNKPNWKPGWNSVVWERK